MRTAKSLEGEREGKAWGDPVEGCIDDPLLSWNCHWWWGYSGFQVKKLLWWVSRNWEEQKAHSSQTWKASLSSLEEQNWVQTSLWMHNQGWECPLFLPLQQHWLECVRGCGDLSTLCASAAASSASNQLVHPILCIAPPSPLQSPVPSSALPEVPALVSNSESCRSQWRCGPQIYHELYT